MVVVMFCSSTVAFSWLAVTPQKVLTLYSRYEDKVKKAIPYGMASGDNENVMESISSSTVDFESLIDMDVVVYSFKKSQDKRMYLGAVQEDGTFSPLSTWTTEPAFGASLEFLVDEEDRFSLTSRMDDILFHTMVPESELSYGSRQCHRGVGNPHGEESEILYYIDQKVIDKYGIEVAIKPHLEILW